MIRKTKNNRRIKATILLTTFMLTMLFMNFSAILPNSGPLVGDEISDEIIGDIEAPQPSLESNDPWWNATFLYRILLNITNPNPVNLIDHTVSFEFDYATIVVAGRMEADLKDIRIVENNMLIDYYIEKDFPSDNIATIWFKTNCSASTTEFDTFMYYNNVSIIEQTPNLLTDNPAGLLHYNFEENGGTKLVNSVNRAYNATTVNGPAWVTDVHSGGSGTYSMDFDGTSDYAYIESLVYNSANAITGLTATCWFRTGYTSTGTNDNWAFLDFDRSEYFNFYVTGPGQIGFSTEPSSGNIDDMYTTTTPLNDNQWHFAAVVFDGNNKYIYVDPESGNPELSGFGNNPHPGVDIGDGTPRWGCIADGSEMTSQNGPRNNIWYDGRIDELRYWEEPLSNTEIYNLFKGYDLTVSVNEEQIQKSECTIIVLDVDGKVVPNAEVSLLNHTTGELIGELKTTSNDGSVIFTRLEYEEYNITVNYSISTNEQVVFNSSTLLGAYNFSVTGLYHTFNITANLWTIDFEIVDWDDYPLNYGYINVSNDEASSVLESLPLDSNGKATFCWIPQASYYYKTYYSNDDYTPAVTLLNESIITRTNYDTSERTYSQTVWVNETNEAGAGATYDVDQSFYAGGTQTTLLNKKILKANITLSDMDETLTSIIVKYLDKDDNSYSGVTDDHVIYSKTYTPTVTDDFIELNMRMPSIDAVQLQADDYQVYGLRIELLGANATKICNGTITVDTIETLNVYNTTALAKIHIQVNDQNTATPVPSTIIHVYNKTSGNPVVNLVSDANGNAYGKKNSDVGFWYLRDEVYNFTLEYYATSKNFLVNETSPAQWEPSAPIYSYNYSLDQNSSMKFWLILNPGQYMANFTEAYGDTNAIWGENITYSVNFSYSTDSGANWDPITGSNDVVATIQDADELPLISSTMEHLGDGNYSITFNSSILSAGSVSTPYQVVITGSEQGYEDPDQEDFLLQVSAVQTDMLAHNYSNPAQNLNVTTQYYNELVNITVSYFIDGSPSSRLVGALLDYSWDYGSGSNIQEDPIHPGYYTFEFNTSTAPTTAQYGIEITMSLENYTKSFLTAYVQILPRLTEINGTTKLKHVSKNVWVKDAYNFTFEYNDTTNDNNFRVGALETAVYNWYKLDTDGSPLGEPSEDVALDYDSVNKLYILDFDTENLTIGDYVLFITLQKNNYEARIAFVNLEIKLRTIDSTVDVGGQVSVVKGADVVITIDLKDISRDNIALESAIVTLTIEGTAYTFTPIGNGIYKLIFPTTNINAFFGAVTLTGSITISKEDYVPQTLSITVVVGMDEIFPGMPMFYFLMIAGAIVAVVGSLVVSRAIRQAKIPRFVKRVREMKSNIQGRKSISESLLYPSKNEYIVKKLGEKWEELGIDLGDILGIDLTKGKKAAPGSKGPIEKREGGVIE